TTTKFVAAGTVGTPSWTLSSGSLPEGMTFNSGGVLDGTPTKAGNYSFCGTVKDQDTPPRSKERGYTLLVGNPAPMIASLSPWSAEEGGSDFLLTVNGSGYVASSVVRWNGEERATIFLSSDQLRAVVSSVDIATAGSAPVTVSNSRPRGGLSDAQTFPVVAATAVARASVDSSGAEGHGPSDRPAISGDGRFVAFESEADDL